MTKGYEIIFKGNKSECLSLKHAHEKRGRKAKVEEDKFGRYQVKVKFT